MTRVVLSPFNVLSYMKGAGHFWVYMQYLQGLARIGCRVQWLECIYRDVRPVEIDRYVRRLQTLGLETRPIVCRVTSSNANPAEPRLTYITMEESDARAMLEGSDLLLNFNPWIAPDLLSRFRRTALVDIDPGLHQVWLEQGQIVSPPHDVYFTVGEEVPPTTDTEGRSRRWHSISPPVCLENWRYSFNERSERFTTVTSWFGDYVTTSSSSFDNGKRISFLEFLELPQHTRQEFELAVGLKDVAPDRSLLERNGWRVRDVAEVADTPDAYRAYIQTSRAEFSCAKPFVVRHGNGWVSDRSACYLASGKPIVVQDTGPSTNLPTGEGVFRFSTLAEAIDAVTEVNSHYRIHCEAARATAERYLDAGRVAETILSVAL